MKKLTKAFLSITASAIIISNFAICKADEGINEKTFDLNAPSSSAALTYKVKSPKDSFVISIPENIYDFSYKLTLRDISTGKKTSFNIPGYTFSDKFIISGLPTDGNTGAVVGFTANSDFIKTKITFSDDAPELVGQELILPQKASVSLGDAGKYTQNAEKCFISEISSGKNLSRKEAAMLFSSLVSKDESLFSVRSLENFSELSPISLDMLVSCGAFIGDETGNMHMNRNITGNEAVTVLIRLLGYEWSANASGAYPAGYISTANKIGLIEDGFSGEAFITAPELLAMTKRALFIPRCVSVGYDIKTGTAYYQNTDKTFAQLLDTEKPGFESLVISPDDYSMVYDGKCWTSVPTVDFEEYNKYTLD